MPRLDLSEIDEAALAAGLSVAGATVECDVPAGLEREVRIPPLREDARLELRWAPVLGGDAVYATVVATRERPSRVGWLTLGVAPSGADGIAADLALSGVSNAMVVRSRGLSLRMDAAFCARLVEIDVEGSLRAAGIADVALLVKDGTLMVMERADGLVIDRARAAALCGEGGSATVRCREVTNCRLEGVSVVVERDGVLLDCVGAIRLVDASGARIVCRCLPGLMLAARTDDETRLDDKPQLAGAVVSGVNLDPSSILKLLDAAPEVSQLDLARGACELVVNGVRDGLGLEVAERLYTVLREKATSPGTVDAAHAVLLEQRRRAARGWNLDYAVLSVARAFHYGASLRRPIVLWACATSAILVHRVVVAMRDPKGLVGLKPSLHVDVTGKLLYRAGDSLLSTVLLPANWVRLQEAAPAVGLSGGYLSAARLFLLAMVILAGAGARSRLRAVRQGR